MASPIPPSGPQTVPADACTSCTQPLNEPFCNPLCMHLFCAECVARVKQNIPNVRCPACDMPFLEPPKFMPQVAQLVQEVQRLRREIAAKQPTKLTYDHYQTIKKRLESVISSPESCKKVFEVIGTSRFPAHEFTSNVFAYIEQRGYLKFGNFFSPKLEMVLKEAFPEDIELHTALAAFKLASHYKEPKA